MATTEQRTLSAFIKSIHKKLREEAIILGTEQAWDKHCKDKENLEKYAKAMQELAINHWDENVKRSSKVISRIMWVYEACKEYFREVNKYRNREVRIAKDCLKYDEGIISNLPLENFSSIKYKLLDVGSCYNPFKHLEDFDVLAIDIAPATSEVHKCDFLNINITDSLVFKGACIRNLPERYFDVVVFSLLLEYFPTPELRLKCCVNAYKVLKPEGILVIITPDSNHIGSNSKIIKSWRYVLAKHGFSRVKYEKLPYLHCMIFRKTAFEAVAQHWAEVRATAGFFEKIYIPQDFQDGKQQKL